MNLKRKLIFAEIQSLLGEHKGTWLFQKPSSFTLLSSMLESYEFQAIESLVGKCWAVSYSELEPFQKSSWNPKSNLPYGSMDLNHDLVAGTVLSTPHWKPWKYSLDPPKVYLDTHHPFRGLTFSLRSTVVWMWTPHSKQKQQSTCKTRVSEYFECTNSGKMDVNYYAENG